MTRFRSVRWVLDGAVWKLSDPWLISFVVCSRDGPGSLLGVFLNVEAVGVAVFWSGGGL
jgi:hypothetical protein